MAATALRGAPLENGQRLYAERCAMCHGADARGDGPLSRKKHPPTPDLTTEAFRRRLAAYPGVIVSSIILQPNGDLIPRTLRENGVRVPPHVWTIRDFRDIDAYMKRVIGTARPRDGTPRR
ncbi:cytochrome c [Sphingomonas sp. RHCKR7]|uniref:c-type cytochrome n=1 Tax=Sphingomonas folli TaxID=2862497 RepID=UPI001C676112|nr:cytochrome c [Sphingomonas folli]MBW6527162.1 cytochrome c [Sphingomonas folli]